MATLARSLRVCLPVVLAALAAAPALAAETKAPARTRTEQARTAPVDLNSATADELKALPGIGSAGAKKIIDNRPYARTAELLDKNVVSQRTYNRIRDRVVAHGGAADADIVVSASPRLPANESPYGRDTVWVDTASGIYHRDGDAGYGKTTPGRYMTEGEAIRAGYRLSKQTETR
jgi:competence protein ComEA